jgi:hypothetical protein
LTRLVAAALGVEAPADLAARVAGILAKFGELSLAAPAEPAP